MRQAALTGRGIAVGTLTDLQRKQVKAICCQQSNLCTAGMARICMLTALLQPAVDQSASRPWFLPSAGNGQLAAEYYVQDLARCAALCHRVAPMMIDEVPPFGTVSCSDLEGEPLTAGVDLHERSLLNTSVTVDSFKLAKEIRNIWLSFASSSLFLSGCIGEPLPFVSQSTALHSAPSSRSAFCILFQARLMSWRSRKTNSSRSRS